MAVSILTLGTIAHYISLGHPTRQCHFNTTTPLQLSKSPSSPSLPHIFTTTAPTRSIINSTYISRTLPTANSTVSLNQTESTAITQNKGLRYFTLAALALFVGAYSFSFGPGKEIGGGLRTTSGWYSFFPFGHLCWSPFFVAWNTLLGSLSKGVFERRTATGSERFLFLGSGCALIFK